MLRENNDTTSGDYTPNTWQINVMVDEHEERTRARARLHWQGAELIGVGLARLSPDDEPVAEIGDELAIARALTDLAKKYSQQQNSISRPLHTDRSPIYITRSKGRRS